MSYEKIVIVGNLGNDPEQLRHVEGTPVTNFSVAVNKRRNGGNSGVNWYRCTVWNGQAENAVQYLKKGSRVLIEGSNLKTAAYMGKDNQPHARLELTADRVVYLDSAPESDNDEEIGDIQS